jgi:hypothetical protein
MFAVWTKAQLLLTSILWTSPPVKREPYTGPEREGGWKTLDPRHLTLDFRESERNPKGETKMKHALKRTRSFVAMLAVIFIAVTAYTETIDTRIGKLDFELGVPTKETVAKLYDELDFQRACQLYLWALPLVNAAQGKMSFEFATGARGVDVGIFEGYRNLSGLLTPNVTTPYISGIMDLASSGPMVVDVPAGLIAGSSMDFWQRPLVDFGVTGPDQGKGGKYLFIGPGQEAPQTRDVTVLHSPTFIVGFFYRAIDPDPAKSEALKKGVRVYPWNQRENPPATRYLVPDPAKVIQVPTMPRGMEYWERLAAAIQHEPVEDRDRFFMAMLKPLGIEKDKPFQPDERQKKILTEAAFVGEAMAKANDFDKRFQGARYRPDAHWDYVITLDPSQDLAGYSQLDERAAWFYEAVFLTKGMISKTPGVGQTYLGAYRDKDGHAFDGGQNYRLHVPPNPPAKQFWSVTLYDADTRALVQNKEEIADRSSRQPDLVKNSDGSVDIYLGPTAPKGFEKNYIPTVPGRAWFTWFRLYAPLEPYFEKTWSLPDIERVE